MPDPRSYALFLPTLALALAAATTPLAAGEVEEANEALVREYYETVLNQDEFDREQARRFLPDDVVAVHPDTVESRESRKRRLIPDLRYEIEEVLADGARVMVRGKEVGTHSGSSTDAPATGNRLEISIVAVYTVRDGKIRDRWALDDMLGLMRTIGYRLEPPGH